MKEPVMTHKTPEPELSHIVPFEKIIDGKYYTVFVQADAEQLKKLAKRMKIPAVKSFAGSVKMTYVKSTRSVEAEGFFDAVVTHTCGVSLENFDEELHQDFTERLMRAEDYNPDDFEAADIDDEPEVFENNEIDAGELLVQQLCLTIPVFPRKPDAEIIAGHTVLPSTPENGEMKQKPFAVLEKLKKSDNLT